LTSSPHRPHPSTTHDPATSQQDKKDKKSAGKDGALPPAADVEGASIEELNQKVVTLEREKNKEEEYRNYMQLERVRVCVVQTQAAWLSPYIGKLCLREGGIYRATDALLDRSNLVQSQSPCDPPQQDKINAFWEITKKDLEDRRADMRNKDREMEEMEERHQVEVKVRALVGGSVVRSGWEAGGRARLPWGGVGE